jgi:hypothetical protein
VTAIRDQRNRRLFCVERDVHEGSLRAVMLPELPAAARRASQDSKAKSMRVELARRDITRKDVLDLHAAL